VITDTARNRTAYLNLVELVRSQRALAFVGAGVTLPLGYPDWDGLIERLAAEVKTVVGEEIQSNGLRLTVSQVLREFRKERLLQAQILKQSLAEKYFSVMSELFGPKERRIAPITDLVTLPFKHLLTSNYDPALEQHHAPANEPEPICLHHKSAGQFITRFTQDGYTRRVVHVHGRYDEPQHIILTEEDYGAYVLSPVVDQFWRSVPVNASLVFVGFSLGDNDLLYGFRRLQMILQETNDMKDPRHFVILPLDDEEKENSVAVPLRMRYGIEPVFYLHRGNDFSEYDELLRTLNADVIGRVPEQLAEPLPVPGPQEYEPDRVEAAGQPQEVTVNAVLEGVHHLKEITRANIARRRTGDLE
jgi:hypothetical protein